MWLVAALAGCGGAGAGRGSVGGTGGVSTNATTSSCGGSQSSGAVTPTVILRNADAAHVVSAPVGSIVELRLEGLHTWSAPTVTPSGALIKVGAQGVQEQGACLWEFKVAHAGEAKIMITEGPLCPPNQMCPMYALLVTFTIHGV